MSVYFSTTEYEFSHGKKPRGYGSWAFFFGRDEEAFWVHQSTYGDAKKKVKEEAERRRVAANKFGFVQTVRVGS